MRTIQGELNKWCRANNIKIQLPKPKKNNESSKKKRNHPRKKSREESLSFRETEKLMGIYDKTLRQKKSGASG
ncbi:hypothetical protein [Cytobacillus sp. IB215665]|uniref:hypothetical protein n=1 Tax=Cytobacillus sp. IB215665 TaxID=3097357 RepID=UPI002A0FAC04|nr:hypothetical protein [Cytobacillus sp. IB215665]MDX8366788.1 hypothetical protein [Cytobacillus sp. IB215665]